MEKTLYEELNSKTLPSLFRTFEDRIKKEYKKNPEKKKNNADIYGKEIVAALFIDFIMNSKYSDEMKRYPETYKQSRKNFIDDAKSYVMNIINQMSQHDSENKKIINRLDSLIKVSKDTIGFNLESKINNYSPALITGVYNALDRKGLYDIGALLTTDIFAEKNTAKFKQYNILQAYLERI
jgi:hypothetical protein